MTGHESLPCIAVDDRRVTLALIETRYPRLLQILGQQQSWCGQVGIFERERQQRRNFTNETVQAVGCPGSNLSGYPGNGSRNVVLLLLRLVKPCAQAQNAQPRIIEQSKRLPTLVG